MLAKLLAAAEAVYSHTTPWQAVAMSIYVLAAGLLLTLAVKVIQDLSDPARHIPGPRLARYTRLWLLYQYNSGKWPTINRKLHDTYGPVVRTAPGQYSLNHPEAIRTVYSHGNGSKFPKGEWYKTFGRPEFPSLFNSRDPHHHSELRRKISPVYSLSALKAYEPYMDQCTELYRALLSSRADSGQAIDFHHFNQSYAYDLVGLITWSSRFGFLDNGEDIHGFMAELDAEQRYFTLIGLYTSFDKFLRPLLSRLKFFGPAGFGSIFAYTDKGFDQKKANLDATLAKVAADPDHAVDFVDKLLIARARDGKTTITDRDIRVAAGSNMGAGSDTTGITLSAIFYYLLRHPAVLATLRAEIAAAGLTNPITHAQAAALPYLAAVIKESLRVHPAVALDLPRVVPASGVTVAGTFIPAGSVVSVNAVTYHSNRAVFGPDADAFRPERWLAPPEARPAEVDFLSFGAGSRTCIGRNISMLEMTKLVPTLVREFDFELVHREKAAWTVRSIFFSRPMDFEVVVKRREEKN